jgi:HEAT repeat protein
VQDLKIVAENLSSDDEEIRRLAVVELSRHPFAEVRELLAQAMGDGSWRVRKETVDALSAFPFDPEIVTALVEMLRSHDNAGMRNSAAETLERVGRQTLPILNRYVADPDPDVSKFVIDILGCIGDSVSVPFLLGALSDPDPNVCAAAAENLGKIGDVAAVPHLLQALAREDLWLRYTTLESLCRIGQSVPLSSVAPLAGEKLLKKAVFDCLGAIGGADAVPILIDGLKERGKSFRDAAAVALIKIKERLTSDAAEELVCSPLRDFVGSQAVEWLAASLETSDRTVKESVITILGIIGDSRVTTRLLQGCHDERLRRQCLIAFRNMGDEGVRSLLQSFTSSDDEERCLIAYVCGELNRGESAGQLREGMHSPNANLRRISVLAAAKIGLTSLTHDVAALLHDADPEVREAAIEVLCCFAPLDRDAVHGIALQLAEADFAEKRRDSVMLFAALGATDKLSLLLKDEDSGVRKVAVASLGNLHSTVDASHFIMALTDEEADVRIAAATALGALGTSDLLGPLLLALKDEDLWVRCAALKSIGKLGTDEAFDEVAKVFSTAEGLELVSALDALAEIGSDRAFALVERALDNPDEDAVKAAIATLSRGGEQWFFASAERLLGHPHWDVRISFAKAMTERLGKRAEPYLHRALAAETDGLVRGQLQGLLDRLQ